MKRILYGGSPDGLHLISVGESAIGPVLIAESYMTVANGRADQISCAEGERITRETKGSEHTFARYRVEQIEK